MVNTKNKNSEVKTFKRLIPADPYAKGLLDPLYILIVAALSIFVAEAFVMIILSFLPPLALFAVALIDASLLSLILFPMLYFLIFRPLNLHITERKKAEDDLLLFRELIDQSNDAIAVIDPETGLFGDVNERLCRSTGYTCDELLSMKVEDLDAVIPDNFVWKEHVDEVREKGFVIIEGVHKRKDGSTFPVEVNVKYVTHNERDYMVGIARDITDRRKVEEKLRASEERQSRISEAAFEGIGMSEKGRLTDANQQLADLLGYTLQELIGIEVKDIVAPESRDFVMQNIKSGFEGAYEHLALKKDGTKIHVEVRAKHILYEGRNVRVTVIRDITDRKRMEEELLRSQKLESVGVLAGGIAHDFNNLLQSIFLNVSTAKIFSEKGSEVNQVLRDTEKVLQKTKYLTNQLLTFSKGGKPVKKTVNLSSVIPDAVRFSLSGSNVKNEVSIAEDLWNIEADEGQINQVLQNIIINADQAMPDGGTLKVKAENITIGEGELPALAGGRYVLTQITDTGTGISEDHLSRIFDPYFTTKQKGSGLGLASSYSIISKHGGLIKADSKTEVGTTFTLYLPATEKEMSDDEDHEVFATGWGRILIMDDEREIRTSLKVFLGTLNYEAEFAEEGAQAIELYEQAKKADKPFDAVILDITVPGGMGGKETVQRLLQIDSGVKAIVSSGYADDPIMADFEHYGFKATLSKPYNVQEMMKVLKEVISG
jgi:PAS domain S-box-containing protein